MVAPTSSPAPAPLDKAPEKTVPQPKESFENLSKKLDRSEGVVAPKRFDPGIEKPTPRTGDVNVIPAPGGSQSAQPK